MQTKLIGTLLRTWITFAVSLILWNRAYAQPADLQRIEATIERVRAKHKLPAMGAMLITSDGVEAIGVTGTRKRNDSTPVAVDDLWHIGSNGKALSATMIARLVERGIMKWSQSIGDTFTELSPQMNVDFESITLEQLLSHRAGLRANFDLVKYRARRDLQAARLDSVKDAMAKGLVQPPGKGFLYSNWGYTVAAAMAERATGKAFETLMSEEVFIPLKMTSVGFGGSGTIGQIDQPWPHTANGRPAASNGPDIDNCRTMAAAGTMHMTLSDWGKFVAEHLRGSQEKSSYLKQDTFARLHTPVDGDYAMGWIAVQRGWAGGVALNHAGDNTMNFALVWAAPAKDFAVLVVTNQSSSHSAADELASSIIMAWAK